MNIRKLAVVFTLLAVLVAGTVLSAGAQTPMHVSGLRLAYASGKTIASLPRAGCREPPRRRRESPSVLREGRPRNDPPLGNDGDAWQGAHLGLPARGKVEGVCGGDPQAWLCLQSGPQPVRLDQRALSHSLLSTAVTNTELRTPSTACAVSFHWRDTASSFALPAQDNLAFQRLLHFIQMLVAVQHARITTRGL